MAKIPTLEHPIISCNLNSNSRVEAMVGLGKVGARTPGVSVGYIGSWYREMGSSRSRNFEIIYGINSVYRIRFDNEI